MSRRYPRDPKVWYDGHLHRITGYGTGISAYLEEHFQEFHGRSCTAVNGYFVLCLTACGLRVQVQVAEDSSLADAGQPGRVTCPACLAAIPVGGRER